MRVIVFLLTIFTMFCTATNAQNESGNPKDFYLAYLEALQAMDSIFDNNVDKFLSKKALDNKNKKNNKYKQSMLTKEQLEMALGMIKQSRVLPNNSQIEAVDKGDSVSLKITAESDEGFLTATIDMVDAFGWKIDKDIWVIKWGENGYFTSELWGE